MAESHIDSAIGSSEALRIEERQLPRHFAVMAMRGREQNVAG